MDKTIEKEMANVRVTFKVLKGVKPDKMRERKVKSGLTFVGTHVIFYTKMDNKFTRKYRLVEVRHETAPPLSITL